MNDHAPAWDPDLATRLDGALVLIGLTYDDPVGPRQEQMYGVVMAVDEREGITIRLEGERSGKLFKLPPDLSAFEVAPAGEYTLRSTGETVSDPDYTASWTISLPMN